MQENIHLGILLILGICAAGGVMGAWLFQKMRIPQVVGYIVIGVLIGDTGFGLLSLNDIAHLQPFNHFALGLIGFLVGGELQGSMFKKYGKQFSAILLGEGLLAFALVGIVSTLIVFFVCHNWITALAAGIVFGAIASATDPASTIDVLWEYRSAGVLTTSIIAIVALDDALAMTLYGLGSSIATILTQSGDASVISALMHTGINLFGAIILGIVCGFVLNAMMHYMPQNERRLGISIGMILLCIGASVAFNMDVILSTMTVGIVLINTAPRRSKKLFEVIRSFSTPIYIVFFVLVGARLSLKGMPIWIWGLVFAYVVMRSLGKWAGAYWGSCISKAEPPVRKFLGMAIFAQGGVAVGLSIVASQNLQNIMVVQGITLGDMIIFTVTATTLCVQLIGPAFAKLAIIKAGEIGRNITETDIMTELTVGSVVNTDITPLKEATPLNEVVQMFSDQDTFVYPVVTDEGCISGIVTFDMLKELLNKPDTWQWLLVRDIMQPVEENLTAGMNLEEAVQTLKDIQAEALPVVENLESNRLKGVLDIRTTQIKVRAELVRRQTAAT
ncbi:MAG: cation:proton antiporter [Kiritimatiellae bacterium]|jgi:Kef-type K+ transport system membrane component KefB/CBS domain-containing protein|nr:cation:proton antiporter [Kiritimatiellia bacterium]